MTLCGELLLDGRIVGTFSDMKSSHPERIALDIDMPPSWSVTSHWYRAQPWQNKPRPSKGWRRHIRRIKGSRV